MLKKLSINVAVAVVVLVCVSGTQAVTIDLVPIGNPGNAADTEVMTNDGTTGYGSAGYTYNIGKYEVTTRQYTEFLNAVARTDTYRLFSRRMADFRYWNWGCNIQRSGSSGSYSYSVAADWADRPVNYVSWGDAARFCNWLVNGQPTGSQDLTTTEDGSYLLNGATTDAELISVTRKTDATWVIPSEDEWYKAAYYDPAKPGGAGYWDYPTGTNAIPSNFLLPIDPGNNANFYKGGYTIGSPYYRTEVGEFENSESPYGTFDQGGNVWEWNEAVLFGSYYGVRGGSFRSGSYIHMHASNRYGLGYLPRDEGNFIGFRVAYIPEPATLSRLPVAVLGTEDFDVNDIDVNTISINDTVFPVRATKIEDVSSPIDGTECECHEVEGDGYADLVIHFSRREVIIALGLEAMAPGTEVPIIVTGELLDGTPFEATDCVTLVPRND
jgi:formylglycine-generating enzyme required for sulfatase activity